MMDSIRAVISDMDGVHWRGAEALPGMVEFFVMLRQRGTDFILASNNSRIAPEDYVKKLAGMGVPDVQTRNIVTSGTATVSYLKSHFPAGAGIYIVGEDGLKKMIKRAGYRLVESNAAAVVCGIDFDLTYHRVKCASLLIRQGARFIGTNPDSSYPLPEGLVPGAGSVIAMLETACGQSPTIIGKPERGMFDAALSQLGSSPSETLMIGDRISTDIVGAQALGIKTALVMTGVEDEASLAASEIKPDYVFPGLPELTAAMNGSSLSAD